MRILTQVLDSAIEAENKVEISNRVFTVGLVFKQQFGNHRDPLLTRLDGDVVEAVFNDWSNIALRV